MKENWNLKAEVEKLKIPTYKVAYQINTDENGDNLEVLEYRDMCHPDDAKRLFLALIDKAIEEVGKELGGYKFRLLTKNRTFEIPNYMVVMDIVKILSGKGGEQLHSVSGCSAKKPTTTPANGDIKQGSKE